MLHDMFCSYFMFGLVLAHIVAAKNADSSNFFVNMVRFVVYIFLWLPITLMRLYIRR